MADYRRVVAAHYSQCPRCGQKGNYFGEFCFQDQCLVVELHCDNGHAWEARFVLHAEPGEQSPGDDFISSRLAFHGAARRN